MLFFEFGIKDVVDIFAVALMLYYIYRLMTISAPTFPLLMLRHAITIGMMSDLSTTLS